MISKRRNRCLARNETRLGSPPPPLSNMIFLCVMQHIYWLRGERGKQRELAAVAKSLVSCGHGPRSVVLSRHWVVNNCKRGGKVGRRPKSSVRGYEGLPEVIWLLKCNWTVFVRHFGATLCKWFLRRVRYASWKSARVARVRESIKFKIWECISLWNMSLEAV